MRNSIIITLLLGCLAVTAAKPRRVTLKEPILGGELSNSAATSVADIDNVMPRMARLGLNTVLVPAYWELMEPVEGQFDFTLIDRTVEQARQNGLKVVFLWFGAWKNSMSCYAPAWFKEDTRRFPRAMNSSGRQLEIASCFSDNVLQADLAAFSALMQHLADTDRNAGTVVMMQIENEIGMLESARDHSPLARKVYDEERWAERYGTGDEADERFMARHYARYVEHLARAARSIYDIPLYVNAAMNSRGRRPGEYPSAGPLAHLEDIWRENAPSIDILAPDIYDTGFKAWADSYATATNQLFIPESRCCTNSGVRALYAFGEHQALGFSPFAIDQASPQETQSASQAYDLLRRLNRLQAKASRQWGLLFDQEDRERIITDEDGVVMTCRHNFTLPWDPRATDGTPWPEGGAILYRLGRYDYLLAGNGVVVDFKTVTEKQQEEQKLLGEDGFATAGGNTGKATATFKGKRLGLLAVDEVDVAADGTMTYLRRENGDQTHQGRHARIGVGEWKMLHIRLYEY